MFDRGGDGVPLLEWFAELSAVEQAGAALLVAELGPGVSRKVVPATNADTRQSIAA